MRIARVTSFRAAEANVCWPGAARAAPIASACLLDSVKGHRLARRVSPMRNVAGGWRVPRRQVLRAATTAHRRGGCRGWRPAPRGQGRPQPGRWHVAGRRWRGT
eukprot:8193898-Lingulodinium_polyedra.AAC.1